MNTDQTDKALEREKEIQRTVNAYHETFDKDAGKKVIEDLENSFHFEQPAFLKLPKGDHYAYDAIHAAIRDGQRSILLHIQARLAAPITGDGNVTTTKRQILGVTTKTRPSQKA